MWHMKNIFDSGTYFAIMCEVVVAVGCILVHIEKYVGSIIQFSIMAV